MSLPAIQFDERSFLADDYVLPPLPEVLHQLIDAMRRGRTSAKEISPLIVADAGMVGHVLKVVNSAYYGLPRQIGDVTHAVAYLGIAEIYRIVLTISVTRSLEPDDPRLFRDHWRHAYYTALISRRVAQDTERMLEPGEVYTAAILHDIGKLVYAQLYPEHYAGLDRIRASEGTFLNEAERRLGLPGHGRLGALALRRWGLPEPIVEACERHEWSDLRAGDRHGGMSPLHRVVAISNMLANIADDRLAEGRKREVAEALPGLLGIREDEFLLLLADVIELRTEVERFLQAL